MAHERLTGQPAPIETASFDGTMYDLGWDGQRDVNVTDNSPLPSADYAVYLINAVKFHCGQMFHLFDEPTFMRAFRQFQEAPSDASRTQGLWYIHFLIVLAFGKAFVAHRNSTRRPPGADLFAQAIKLMPDIVYLLADPLEAVEILCCKALYLQCLDFRSAAYNVVRVNLHH